MFENRKETARFCVSAFSAFVVLLLFVISFLSIRISSFLNKHVGGFVRAVLSHLSSLIFPPLFEILLLLLAVLLVSFMLSLLFLNSISKIKKRFVSILTLFTLLFSLYVSSIGFAYNSNELYKDFFEYQVPLESDVEKAVEKLVFDVNGYSRSSDREGDANTEILSSYISLFSSKLPFIPRMTVKKSSVSSLLARLDILSLFSPFTGEIYLNIEIPDYMMPFTVAHEYAHAIGASGEADANTVAYIVSMNTENDFVKYSASLSILEYFLSELSSDRIYDVYSKLSDKALKDIEKYRLYLEKYRSDIGVASDKINGLHTSVYGRDKGYSYTVSLISSYIKNNL